MLYTFQKRKVIFVGTLLLLALTFLMFRCISVSVYHSEYLGKRAIDNQQRERKIKAARGRILDRNGIVLADNKTVCNVSVIHSQIKDVEGVVLALSKELNLPEEQVRKRVEKVSSIEKIKNNVPKEVGDIIREMHLEGVKVDEDYKRFYPYDSLGSKVIGFTGGDNQGIVGLEAKYDDYLTGKNGKILTMTDSKGIEVKGQAKEREESVPGNDLYISMDYNIQKYATQIAQAALIKKQAKSVSIIVMKVKTGEILAMVNEPEFSLNDPFVSENQEECNKAWRNGCINDSYEPGSTFKIITASAALEEGVVDESAQFFCPGYIVVSDRRIRCAKVQGHGAQDFMHATMNSCNPAFITIGLRLGVDNFVKYFEKFGLKEKTGIDLAGEAKTIMHKKENMKEVELATCSFGQSFQVSPIRFLTTAAGLINDGTMVTPHFGIAVAPKGSTEKNYFSYSQKENLISKNNSDIMKKILEQVVENGTGKNGYVEGYRVGGKTATSQTIPRGNGVYIASFLGFAPANDPEVIALAIVNEPKGMYYGGQVAAPIIRQLFENILSYLENISYN